MNFIFCNSTLIAKLSAELEMSSAQDKSDYEFVKKLDELNTKIVLQRNKAVNVVFFGDALLDAFGGGTGQIISYLAVIKTLGKLRMVYLSENPETDEVACYLANNGVTQIIRQEDYTKLNMEYIRKCLIIRNDLSIISNLVDLKRCDVDTVVSTLKYLLDQVYSQLNSSNLSQTLSKHRDKFLAIEFKLANISTKITEIEDMLKFKEVQMSDYKQKYATLNAALSELTKIKDNLVESLAQRDNDIAQMVFQMDEIQKHQQNVLENLKNGSNLIIYTTKDIDMLQSNLQAVLVFKEYTYTRYFNTFIKYLYNYLKSKFNNKRAYRTRVVVYEPHLDGNAFTKFYEFTNCSGNDYLSAMKNKDLLITNEVRSDFMKSVVEDDDYDILIVVDRRKEFAKDMYKGIKVARFSVADSSSDVRSFKISESTLLSSGTALAKIQLTKLPVFLQVPKSVTAETIVIEKTIIVPFIEKIETLYNITLLEPEMTRKG